MKSNTTASGRKSKLFRQDDKGFRYLIETGELIGHEDECKATYEALAPLFAIFEDIRKRMEN